MEGVKKHLKRIIIYTLLSAMLFSAFPAAAYAQRKGGSDKAKYVTLMFTGDLMCDGQFQEYLYNSHTGRYEFDGVFKYVKPLFSEADYVMGNLETCVSSGYPLGKERKRINGKPYHNAPESFLKALKRAGMDGLVMANNHNLDTGKKGLRRTIDAVEKNGFDHTGAYIRSKDDHFFIIRKNGVRIAVLAYAKYYNERDKKLSTKEKKRLLSKYSSKKVRREVKAAKAAGADLVIAYIHMGKENTYEISGKQKKTMKEMADAGVDYIIGSHPHVLQQKGYVRSRGRKVPCIYSMGNFTGFLDNEMTRETAILKIRIKKKNGKTTVAKSSFIPCFMAERFGGESLVLVPSTYNGSGTGAGTDLYLHYNHIRKILNNRV